MPIPSREARQLGLQDTTRFQAGARSEIWPINPNIVFRSTYIPEGLMPNDDLRKRLGGLAQLRMAQRGHRIDESPTVSFDLAQKRSFDNDFHRGTQQLVAFCSTPNGMDFGAAVVEDLPNSERAWALRRWVTPLCDDKGERYDAALLNYLRTSGVLHSLGARALFVDEYASIGHEDVVNGLSFGMITGSQIPGFHADVVKGFWQLPNAMNRTQFLE